MNKVIIFAGALLISASIYAQSPREKRIEERQARRETQTNKQQNDPKADKILEQLSNNINRDIINLNFSFYIENRKENISENQTGSISYSKGKYVINFADRKIICDGITTWTYNIKRNEVVINNADENFDNVNPLTIITNYKKMFRSKLIREDIVSSVPIATIDLTPITAQAFYKIRVVVDKKQNMIKLLEVHATNNNILAYKIDKYTSLKTVSKDYFSFDTTAIQNIEIIDNR